MAHQMLTELLNLIPYHLPMSWPLSDISKPGWLSAPGKELSLWRDLKHLQLGGVGHCWRNQWAEQDPPSSIIQPAPESSIINLHFQNVTAKFPRDLFFFYWSVCLGEGFPGGSVVKNLPANVRDEDLIPGSERSPGEENGNPLQYSCLGNPMNREESGGLQSMGLQKSQTQHSD